MKTVSKYHIKYANTSLKLASVSGRAAAAVTAVIGAVLRTGSPAVVVAKE
jgi:hypothetical protein